MLQYIGTKIVAARPMNRADYNTYRGWALPADEDGRDEGYLVEYHDGGTPNDKRHAGYISWCPAEQFERANVPIPETEGKAPHQIRVIAERADMDARAERLRAFIMGKTFDTLPQDEQHRMHRQYTLMRELSCVLGERIAAF